MRAPGDALGPRARLREAAVPGRLERPTVLGRVVTVGVEHGEGALVLDRLQPLLQPAQAGSVGARDTLVLTYRRGGFQGPQEKAAS